LIGNFYSQNIYQFIKFSLRIDERLKNQEFKAFLISPMTFAFAL
jgi:hypothetical protein